MKKKLLAAVFALAMLFCLTACSGGTEEAEATVDNMFAALQSDDFTTAQEYFVADTVELNMGTDEESGLDLKKVGDTIFSNLSYEIVAAEEVDSETVNVTVDVTAIDMQAVINQFMQDAMDYAVDTATADGEISDEQMQADISAMLLENMQKDGVTTTTTEVVMQVVLVDGSWQIAGNEDIVNALTGNLGIAASSIE